MTPRRRRNYNPQLVSSTRSYSTEEVCDLFEVHPNTIRNWRDKGLQVIDDRQPILFHGSDLKQFLKNMRSGRKHTCAPDELFCFKCRLPQKPKNNEFILVQSPGGQRRIRGVCNHCGTVMNRAVSSKNIDKLPASFCIVTPQQSNLKWE